MALKIRLARAGSKKRPYYHIVVADSRSPRDGRFIEAVGSWNPLLPRDGDRVQLNADRISHWLGNGALPTDPLRLARASTPCRPSGLTLPMRASDGAALYIAARSAPMLS